jgi:WD40 repeat protein
MDLPSKSTTSWDAYPELAMMLATISGQVPHLGLSSPVNQPGYVLRQLCLQAAELGDDRLASGFRARLRSQPDPGLIPIWTTRRTSRALSVDLGRHALSIDLGRDERGAMAMAVLPDGRVVSHRIDGRMLVWDPARPGTDPVELGRHERGVMALAVLPDGRVVSGGIGGRVVVWDPARPGTDPIELGRHSKGVTALVMLPDGRVVSGGNDRRVLIWNLTGRGQNSQLGCSVSRLAAGQTSRGKACLIVVHEDQGFSLWSAKGDEKQV